MLHTVVFVGNAVVRHLAIGVVRIWSEAAAQLVALTSLATCGWPNFIRWYPCGREGNAVPVGILVVTVEEEEEEAIHYVQAYFELPISLSKLRRLMQFRLGSHDLPVEQGRMARPIVPRYLRRCTLCSRHAPGDERHFMLECPQFDDIRAQYPDLLQDARDSMRNLMWHQNQKALSDFVIAILDEPRT